MKFSRINLRRSLHSLTQYKNASGFSILEAVVVVGVLLALAVGGFFSYGAITQNAKVAAVKSTASQIYTAVAASLIDGDPSTSPQDVIDKYNESNDKITVDIREGELVPRISAMTTASVSYIPQAENDFCVVATNRSENKIFAEVGTCGNFDDTPVVVPPTDPPSTSEPTPEPTVEPSPEPTTEPTPEPTTPPVTEPPAPVDPIVTRDPLMITTWNTALSGCSKITLPLTGTIDAQINWGDGKPVESFKSVNGAVVHQYQAPLGPTTIKIDGKFSGWSGIGQTTIKCLNSIDTWGETGTTDLSFGFNDADNLTNVASIPSTVTNLTNAFSNIDRNFTISDLPTRNVTSMAFMFSNSKFNNPINFETGNVESMRGMFNSNTVFNQPINLVTPKLKDTTIMFANATGFKQPVTLSGGVLNDTSSMFYNASAFTGTLNFSDTSNITRMDQMFDGAVSFKQDLSGWNVSKVTTHINFAKGTSPTKWPVSMQPRFPS